MHVAFVIDNLGSGGAQRQAAEVAVRLHRDAGVAVSFAIYRDFDFFRPRLEEAGIPVRMLEKRGPLDPLFPRRLRAWIAERRPDLVHVFLPAPVVWTAWARRPLPPGRPVWVAAERSLPSLNVAGAWSRMMRWAYRRYDAVTVNAHPAADELVRDYGLPADRVHYLPNGIDLADWDRRAARPSPHDLDPGRFRLALVGRMTEEKNHRLLLEALARLPAEARARLDVLFVGSMDADRPLAAAVRGEIETRGLSGTVRCVRATAELPALMAGLDALALPSRFEGFPNVVLEGMASRLPILAARVGDVPFMLEDGRSGILVPGDDVDALSAGLARLLAASPDARRTMGAAARAAVESRYRIEHVAELHLSLYRRLADGVRGDAAGTPLG